MIGTLIAWLTGGGVTGIVDRLADAYEAKQKAETDKDKIKAETEIARLTVQMQAQVNGDASWLPKVVRGAWAALFLIYFGKVIIWDKMLGLGVTPDLSDNQWWLVFTVMGFYFLRDVSTRR